MVALVSFDAPENQNYAATIVQVSEPLSVIGLDNLVAVPLYGYQALTQKNGIKAGDLRVLFLAETQLSFEYANENNLHRDATLNKDANETGYLEDNRRVKAIRLRKNNSNALLMPLSSLAFTGYDVDSLKVGDTFDTLNGVRICRKYYIPKGVQAQGQPKVRKQVDERLFPRHLDTEHLFRNLHYLRELTPVVITQKLHGTSWRGGNIPVNRDKGWFERVVVNKWLRIATPDTEYKHVYGSRNVVKGRSDNNHYYDTDLWIEVGKKVDGKIPENFIIYGEVIGWVGDQPIQKGYTYNQAPGAWELYVYRVATVNPKGVIADLSWQGVKDFAASLGLRTVPELFVGMDSVGLFGDEQEYIEYFADSWLDVRFAEKGGVYGELSAVPLSNAKTVDEGVCVRIEGQIPRVLKAKSPLFLEHETKALDAGVEDLESAA